MPPIKLSLLAIVLGLLALPAFYGVARPAKFATMLRRFPRYTPVGYVLMIGATLWFLLYLKQESISDFVTVCP